MDKHDEKAQQLCAALDNRFNFSVDCDASYEMVAQALRDAEREGRIDGLREAARLIEDLARESPSQSETRHGVRFARKILELVANRTPPPVSHN